MVETVRRFSHARNDDGDPRVAIEVMLKICCC